MSKRYVVLWDGVDVLNTDDLGLAEDLVDMLRSRQGYDAIRLEVIGVNEDNNLTETQL